MGNHVIVMNGDRKVIGKIQNSLACLAVVNKIVKKYNGENLPIFGDVNMALERVYAKCEGFEEVQLLTFINDKSTFDKTDILKFDEAISNWDIGNEGPKRTLEFIRGLLDAHETVLTEYQGVSTIAVSITAE
jgi:hypothetical protein